MVTALSWLQSVHPLFRRKRAQKIVHPIIWRSQLRITMMPQPSMTRSPKQQTSHAFRVGGMSYTLALINHRNTSQSWVYVCGSGRIELSSEGVTPNPDVA